MEKQTALRAIIEISVLAIIMLGNGYYAFNSLKNLSKLTIREKILLVTMSGIFILSGLMIFFLMLKYA
jgi:hypothetical protein